MRAIDGAGSERSTTYTPNGDGHVFTDLTGTAAATATLDFDLDGEDPTNNLTHGELGAGEQIDVHYCDPGATSGRTQCGSYAQHAYQPIDVEGPDQNRYFAYNATGDLTSVKDDATSPTNQATLDYNTSGSDTDGTLKTATDGNGHTTSFGYDSNGQ